jgi:type IV pilus assembly protein PilK
VAQHWSIRNLPEMDAEQFRLWQALLEERTGMALAPERKTFLETSLSMRMRELGLDKYDVYYEQLVNRPPADTIMEWSILVDRLTVQETSFFRHRGSYDLVEKFLRDRFSGPNPPKQFNVWSVGCSSGEEPYSLAVMMTEIFAALKVKPYWGITATDISLPVLAKARRGVYSARKVELVDPVIRQRYFTKISDREYEIAAELKSRICFARVNVLELQKVPFQDLDLIYCQNMLIYFRRWRKREIVTRLADRMAPGGLMVLGLGEVVDWQHPQMDKVRFDNSLAFMRRTH